MWLWAYCESCGHAVSSTGGGTPKPTDSQISNYYLCLDSLVITCSQKGNQDIAPQQLNDPTNTVASSFGKYNTCRESKWYKCDIYCRKTVLLLFFTWVWDFLHHYYWMGDNGLDVLLTLTLGSLWVILIKSWCFWLFLKLWIWTSQSILNPLQSQQTTHHTLKIFYFYLETFCLCFQICFYFNCSDSIILDFVNTTGCNLIFFSLNIFRQCSSYTDK